MSEPWAAYSVGKLGTRKNWTNPDCCPLDEIFHVTHVHQAISIVRDGGIMPGLVGDESILKQSRLTVAWLSPNDWSGAGGSRYGNVEFVFDWAALTRDRNAFWVEAITDYSPTACRLLISKREKVENLLPYDPDVRSGPWWHNKDTGSHYWNGRYCLEILLTRRLSLENIKEIRFTQHHPERCCISPGSCRDAGVTEDDGGAIFISGLIAEDLGGTAISRLLTKAGGKPRRALSDSWEFLLRKKLRKVLPDGKIPGTSPEALHLAKAALTAYYHRDKKQFEVICNLFKSSADLIQSCADVVETHFGITGLEI
jgi:hypothetical protein